MFLVLVTCPCPMPFPLLQALLLLPLLPLLAVSQISVRLLLCSFCFRGAIKSKKNYIYDIFIYTYFLNGTSCYSPSSVTLPTVGAGTSEGLFLFLSGYLLCSFPVSLLSYFAVRFILISRAMLGSTVFSSVNVCLFPQSARSAGLRVIPTA